MKIIIINGVTGTIGNALFESHITDPETIVIGLSRRGITMRGSLNHHMILSLDLGSAKDVERFVKEVYALKPSEIIYYHCIGAFKTELDPITYQRKIDVDRDNDGVDDETLRDVYLYLKILSQQLLAHCPKSTAITIATFGSIAEEHDVEIFHSWITARKMIGEELRTLAGSADNVCVYNFLISTLLSAKEMLARPYVFGTDADPRYWLKASDLIRKVRKHIDTPQTGYHLTKVFKKAPQFKTGHFENENIKARRLHELYGA